MSSRLNRVSQSMCQIDMFLLPFHLSIDQPILSPFTISSYLNHPTAPSSNPHAIIKQELLEASIGSIVPISSMTLTHLTSSFTETQISEHQLDNYSIQVINLSSREKHYLTRRVKLLIDNNRNTWVLANLKEMFDNFNHMTRSRKRSRQYLESSSNKLKRS
jgi:hypothetical protein